MCQFADTGSVEGINVVSLLASQIFREYFTPMIGLEQVEYMLEQFQDPEVLFAQMEEGYRYTLVYQGREVVGYFSVKQEADRLLLSKFYLKKKYRGKGLGRKMMDEIFRRAQGLHAVYLYVNKENKSSIAAYQKMGFSITGEPVTDIGGGFIMDDYIMEKVLEDKKST